MRETTFKRLIFILLPVFCILLSGCSGRRDDTVIWQVSDIHYISGSLIEDRAEFEKLMEDADGKVTQYIDRITDAFISEALEAKPDAVIISGDLTMNGAKASHEEFAAKISQLTAGGIKVLVIPGNHDVGKRAYRFTAGGIEEAEGIDAGDFRRIYSGFGYSDALSEDEETLSYIYQINDGLRILMVDVNTALMGSVPRSTLRWIEAQLSQAESEGCRVIAVSHQNLFVQNPLFNFGYQINNSEKLAALYGKYNVRLNLSGHLHIQHITCENGITDIAASSLAVFPNQYGILDVGQRISYRTSPVKVSVDGIDDFAAYSSDFFDRSNSKFSSSVTDEFSPEEKEEMVTLAREMNRGLFSGYIEKTDEAVMEKWSRVPGFSYRYLSSMLKGVGIDYRKAEIDFD